MEKMPAYQEVPIFDENKVAPEVKRLASCFNMAARGTGMNATTMQRTVELYAGTVGDVSGLQSKMLTADAQAYFRYKVLETVAETHNIFMPVGIKVFNEQIESAKKQGIIPGAATPRVAAV